MRRWRRRVEPAVPVPAASDALERLDVAEEAQRAANRSMELALNDVKAKLREVAAVESLQHG